MVDFLLLLPLYCPVMILLLMHWTKLAKRGINAKQVLLKISIPVTPKMWSMKLVMIFMPSVSTVSGILPTARLVHICDRQIRLFY